MRVAPAVVVDRAEHTVLQIWSRLGDASRLALRAQIVLLAAQGKTNLQVAQELGVSPKSAALWRRRFLERRLAGIETEAPRGKSGNLQKRGAVET